MLIAADMGRARDTGTYVGARMATQATSATQSLVSALGLQVIYHGI